MQLGVEASKPAFVSKPNCNSVVSNRIPFIIWLMHGKIECKIERGRKGVKLYCTDTK